MLRALPDVCFEGALSAAATTLNCFASPLSLLGGWILFIHWVNVCWTSVMAICPMIKMAVDSSWVPGLWPLSFFSFLFF